MKRNIAYRSTAIYLLLISVLFGGCVDGPGSNYVRQSPLEIYSDQVAEAENRKSPLVITGIRTSRPNSAGGVDVYVDFLSASRSPIKYVIFIAVPYNAVQDKVASQIGRKIRARLKATGPYGRGATNAGTYWENVWYNSTIVCAAIESVEVILMNGTTKNYSGENLGDVFASDYINHCGNNSVKSALNTRKEIDAGSSKNGKN